MITEPLNCDMTGIFDYPLYFEAFLWKIVFLESLINALSHSVRIFKIGRKSEKLCRIKDRGSIFDGHTVVQCSNLKKAVLPLTVFL